MAGIATIRSMPAYRKGLIAVLIVAVSYTLFGFFGLPAILESVLPKTLSNTLHRKATLREIRFNPFELSLSIRGLDIAERGGGGTWISADEIFANLQLVSLFRWGPILSEIRLVKPYVSIARQRDGSYNFTDLVEEFSKKPAKETKPLNYSLNNIRVVDGRIDFDDGPKKTRHEVRGIRIGIPFVSNLPYYVDRYIQPSFEAVVNGDTVSLKGRSKPFSESRETTFDVKIRDLDIPYYLAYLPERREFEIPSGVLDVKAAVSFAQYKGKLPVIRVEGNVTLRDLRLRGKEKSPMLSLPWIEVVVSPSDIVAREFRVASLTVKDPGIDAVIDRNGKLNLLRLSTHGVKGTDPEKSAETRISIEAIRLSGGKVRFRDRTTDPPIDLSLDRLHLAADNVRTEKNRKALLSFSTRVHRTGGVSLDGVVSVDPPSMAAKIRAKGIPISPVQPYFTDKVKILVTRGAVSAEGDLSVDATKGGPTRVGYKGKVSVNGFSSVDKERGEEFLKFATLHLGGIDAGNAPRKVSIRGIALSDFFSRIVVNPDATLNVRGIIAKAATAGDNAAAKAVTASPVETAEPVAIPVRIETVTLQGGTILFSDRYVKPNYTASLVEIGGRVSGLSSEESLQADVDLRGKLGNAAPLEIRGKINPLAKNLFVDLKVDFREMDLSMLSPYAGRYAGYGIRKGRLALELKYHIEKKKLEAENKVFLDQFTFGEAVDSPDATKLPVRLAIALLTDRKGEIHLDLPVTGQIDDPKFSVWGVVWQIVKNLLVKAATSPFALLGAIFGGGEELAYLEFDPGTIDLPGTAEAKIGSLARILVERPGLRLEIEGHVDVERDSEGWRRLLFRRKVAARKVRELVRSGQAVPALDNVPVDAAEYPKYLAQAYREEKFPKPRNFLGMAKDLPVAEMEKLMLTHIPVTNDDLRQIALQRASSVKERLIRAGKVEPGRIFLVEPKTLPPERKGKLRDSRVDFRIK
ncbi:MAG: hypothetical protein AUK27_12890 [Deltaproteobacteria bacterium CG2_30_66_27]|nr:MAG: hypothetical protein AUK27_12890 [Deltaproteobacteria bacterium CG2_30_66_27]